MSVVYLNLDAEDLTRFLSLFIDKTKDVDMPWYNELFGPAAGQCNEDYSEWNVYVLAEEKCGKITNDRDFCGRLSYRSSQPAGRFS